MTRYSVQPRDRIIVKGSGFLSFTKNLGKIQPNGKYSQKFFNHAKQPATHAVKTFAKIVIQKTEEVTGDLTENKIAKKIIKLSKNSQKNNSETVANEHCQEKINKRYVSPEEIQEIIEELRLKLKSNSENDKEIPKDKYISLKLLIIQDKL